MTESPDRAIARKTLTPPGTWPRIDVVVWPAWESNGEIRVKISRKDDPEAWWAEDPSFPSGLLADVSAFLAEFSRTTPAN